MPEEYPTAAKQGLSKRTVRILNPMPGGSKFTNRQAAKRHVARGRAIWLGEDRTTIEMVVNSGYTKQANAIISLAERIKRAGYDGVNREMSIEEMANIPIVAPYKLLRGKQVSR
jgi:hypothetical protein